MQIHLACSLCVGTGHTNWQVFTVNDQSLYRFTCSKGHASVAIVTEPKYVQLFEIGLNAIVDHYYREAVSSFAASLERFYEFAFHAFALHRGVTREAAVTAWAPIARQSERQLGAFLTAYLLAEGQAPALLTNKMTSFRNDVIHRGVVPTHSEALAFGNAVLDLVRPGLHLLRTKYEHSFEVLNSALRGEALAKLDLRSELPYEYSSYMALRGVGLPAQDTLVLEDYLHSIAARKASV